MNHWRRGRPSGLSAALCVLATVLVGCVDQDPMSPLRTGDGPQRSEITAAAFTGDIRIGVVPVANTVTIGSGGSFVVRSVSTGEEIASGSNGDVVVSIASPPQVATHFWLQIVYTTSQAYIDDWVARATALGYETMVEQHPSLAGKRLLLGKWPSSASWTARVGYKNTAIDQGLAASDAFWRLISESEPGTVNVTSGGTTVVVGAPVVLEADDVVRINGKSYRGVAEVGYNSIGTLAGISELPIEQYLYGVVPQRAAARAVRRAGSAEGAGGSGADLRAGRPGQASR